MIRTHEARAIAGSWLKDESRRNPDELVNEQRMAAMLLVALDEIDLLTSIIQLDWKLSGTSMTFDRWIALRGGIAEKVRQK